MKEYVEIRSGQFDRVFIHTEEEVVKTDFQWYSGKIKVINQFAKDGWKVVGYEKDGVMMEREKVDTP